MRQGLLSEPEATFWPCRNAFSVSRSLVVSPDGVPARSDATFLWRPSTTSTHKTSKTPPTASTPRTDATFLWRPSQSQQKKNGTRQFQHCQTPEPKHPSNRHIQYIISIRYLLNSITTRKFSQQLKIAGLHFNIRSQLLTLRANIRHLKNTPLTNPPPETALQNAGKLRMILFKCIPCIHNLHHISNISNITNTHNQHQPFPYYHLCFFIY